MLRRVPAVLGGNKLYATSATTAGGVLVIIYDLGYQTLASLSALVAGTGLSLLARWRGWILPGADAWSPASVVPARFRTHHRGNGRGKDADNNDGGNGEGNHD